MLQLSVWCEKCDAARHYSVIGNQLLFANNKNRVRWVVLCLSQDGACTDLFENFSDNSLKGDLSNNTTFNPPLFSLVNTFKSFWIYFYFLWVMQAFLLFTLLISESFNFTFRLYAESILTVPQRLSSMFLGGVDAFVYFPHCTVAKFIVSDLGESWRSCRVVVSCRPAGFHRLAGWYDNPTPESTISPSQGLWIWLLVPRHGVLTNMRNMFETCLEICGGGGGCSTENDGKGPGFSSIYILSPWGQMATTKKKRRQMAEGRESWCSESFNFSWQNLEINPFKIKHLSMRTWFQVRE